MSLSPTPTIFSPLQSSKNSGDLPKNKKKKKGRRRSRSEHVIPLPKTSKDYLFIQINFSL